MDKKQLLGLAAATVAFIAIGSASLLVHRALDETDIFSWFSNYGYDDYEYDYSEDSYEFPEEEFIASVYVEGDIVSAGYDYYEDSSYDHQWTLDYIDGLVENTVNKGLMLYINSAGGGVYESDELYLKLMEYKEKTGRPVWTYMASEACSGGYYIAMASDKIYCNRNGLTGSIGVVMTLSDYTDYMKEMGISEVHIVSGENKTMGSGTEPLTEEQKAIFQSLVDESYDQFIHIVADGRKMAIEKVRELADGRVYSPKQALNAGLIDEISTFEDAEEAFKQELDIENILTQQPTQKLKPDGEDSLLVKHPEKGRLMYYATPMY